MNPNFKNISNWNISIMSNKLYCNNWYNYLKIQKDTYTLGGAVVGGVIGNPLGSGSGKDAATIIGVILGFHWGSKCWC